MADGCLFEPIHGYYPESCTGACKLGKDHYCSYYYIDEFWHTMHDWKKEANVKTAISWKIDYENNKMTVYAEQPGYFIGLKGSLYNKYFEILKKHKNIENGIEFVTIDDYIDGE